MIARLLLLGSVILLAGFTEPVPQPKPLDAAEAAQKGRELVTEILSRRPVQNSTNDGVLKIRDAKGQRTEMSVRFEVTLSETNASVWSSGYETTNANHLTRLTVFHASDQPQFYHYHLIGSSLSRANNGSMFPFADSDFGLTDLALEFFYWPEQRILKSELRKTRLCRVLESINPWPTTNAYSRVVSWIDDESRGILHAEAYDTQNKLLKEFDTKKFKKVNGEWQLEQMEISNVQTRSRSQIEFNFDAQ